MGSNEVQLLYLIVFLAELRTLYQHKMSLFDILGMRLNNHLKNPTDSTFKLNSLCIILI